MLNGYFPPLFAEVETIIVLHANSAFRSFAVAEPERALLFIDMRSSTAITERVGELGFLNLLNRMSASSVSPISAPAFTAARRPLASSAASRKRSR